MLLISIRSECTDKFTVAAFGVKGPPYAAGSRIGKTVIHQPIYRNLHTVHRFRIQVCVYFWFAKRNEAGAVQRKIVLQEIALVCIVTESTGQVFTDNTVDFS